MNRLIVAIVALGVALSASAQGKRDMKPSEIYDQSVEAVCAIITVKDGTPTSMGSGFVISTDGLIATNRHVVEGASEILVKCGQLVPVRGSLAKVSGTVDLALVRTNLRMDRPLSISTASPAKLIGQVVYVIGNPEGLEGTISSGLISGVRQRDGTSLIQISAPISHGSSGGPVILGNGQVIGVTTALLAEGQNLNFALPASLLRDLPPVQTPQVKDANGLAPAVHPGAQSEGHSPTLQAADLESAIVSKGFWASVEWGGLGENGLIRALPLADPPIEGKEWTVIRQDSLSFLGSKASIYFLRYKLPSAGAPGLLLTVRRGVSREYCRRISAQLDKGLGTPAVSNEISFGVDDNRSVLTRLKKQWDIFPSRVSWECRSWEPEQPDDTVSMMKILGQHQRDGVRDLPFTWIRCAVTGQTTTKDPTRGRIVSPPEVRPDVVLAIDEVEKRVYEEDRGPTGEAEFSDTRIRIVRNWGARTDEVVIDRRTGSYFERRNHTSGLVVLEVNGTCSRFDPKKAVF